MALGTELILLGMLLCLSWVGARVAARIGIPAIPIYMLVGVLFSKSFGWFPLSVGYTHTVELLGVFGLVLLLTLKYISEPTRQADNSYSHFCLNKKIVLNSYHIRCPNQLMLANHKLII